MGFFFKPAFVHTACPQCKAVFLVESQAAGTACLCPECGADAVAPQAPRPAGFPVLAGLLILAGTAWVWVLQGEREPVLPPATIPSPPVAVAYEPSDALPTLELSAQPKPQASVARDDFSESESLPFLPPRVAAADTTVAEPKKVLPVPQPKAGPEPEPKAGEKPELPIVEKPGHDIPELSAAVAAFRKQDVALARIHLEQAAKAHPELPPAPFLLGELYLAANQPAAARLEFEKTATAFPGYAGTYAVLGEVALRNSQITEAALCFEKAKSLEEAIIDPVRRKKLQVAIRLALATIAEHRKDWPSARASAEEWLALEPQSSPAWAKLGRALLALNRPDEAFQALDSAAAADPRQLPAEAAMALCSTELGDLTAAEEWIAKALTAHSKNAREPLYAASWYLERDRIDDARPMAVRAHDLDPTSTDALLMRALVARRSHDYREAERWLEQALRDAPANFAISNQLALVLVEQDDALKRRRGVGLAEANARAFPQSIEAASTLGWAYYRSGKIEAAHKALEFAVSRGRASSDTAYYLAHVLADRGQVEEAARLVQVAMNASGPFSFRPEAQQWLARLTSRPIGVPPALPAAKEPAATAAPYKNEP